MNIKNNKNCKITIKEKEKTAEVMFKELGYKNIEDKYNINYIKMYSFINGDKVREQFKNDICISCLCVGYLIPIKDVICRRLIIDSSEGTNENYKCTAKEIFNV